MAYLGQQGLRDLGFKHLGSNVELSDKASVYGAARIEIGDNTRIDDFCVLSAGEDGISIGKHVHVAVYTSLIGAGRIEIGDFANLSSRVSVYSSNDDYSGEYMTNPTIPAEYTNVTKLPVTIGSHVIVGSGSVILPGVTLRSGAAVGALSLIKSDCDAFGIYAGVPAKRIGDRKRGLLERQADLSRRQ
jgi:acetyltransferase-like isoleucine patch superfamily enzyme